MTARVPAGGALAVDRERFSRHRLRDTLSNHPITVTVKEREISEIPTTARSSWRPAL